MHFNCNCIPSNWNLYWCGDIYMLALVDGDIVVHRIGFTTENDDWNIAKWRIDETLDNLLIDTNATEYRIYLSDTTENGFRQKYYPEYKANRKAPKPKHYDRLKEYLLTEWEARITMEQEADDALGIDQVVVDRSVLSNDKRSVICSIDKDLLQIPGLHWNFVKKEWKEVSPQEALLRFYHQLLTGDTSDNVKGIKGTGPIRAANVLSGATRENQLFALTASAYKEWLKVEWSPGGKKEPLHDLDEFQQKQMYDIILITGIVLKIRQEEGEIWQFPKEFKKLQPKLALE